MSQMSRFSAMREKCAAKPHGTRLRYISGCRCMLCRAANSRYETERCQARRNGDWNGIVDAERAREHLAWLSANGVGRHSVAAATDISDATLYGIITGERSRLRARTERKILAVDLSARGGATKVSSVGAWRLIDSLLSGGYTKTQLAKWLGYKGRALQFIRGKQMTARNVSRIERLYKLIDAGKMRR